MAKQTFHVCYHCKNRTIGCHSNCELYLKEAKENDEMKKQKFKESEIDNTLHNCSTNRFRSMKKLKRVIK